MTTVVMKGSKKEEDTDVFVSVSPSKKEKDRKADAVTDEKTAPNFQQFFPSGLFTSWANSSHSSSTDSESSSHPLEYMSYFSALSPIEHTAPLIDHSESNKSKAQKKLEKKERKKEIKEERKLVQEQRLLQQKLEEEEILKAKHDASLAGAFMNFTTSIADMALSVTDSFSTPSYDENDEEYIDVSSYDEEEEEDDFEFENLDSVKVKKSKRKKTKNNSTSTKKKAKKKQKPKMRGRRADYEKDDNVEEEVTSKANEGDKVATGSSTKKTDTKQSGRSRSKSKKRRSKSVPKEKEESTQTQPLKRQLKDETAVVAQASKENIELVLANTSKSLLNTKRTVVEEETTEPSTKEQKPGSKNSKPKSKQKDNATVKKDDSVEVSVNTKKKVQRKGAPSHDEGSLPSSPKRDKETGKLKKDEKSAKKSVMISPKRKKESVALKSENSVKNTEKLLSSQDTGSQQLTKTKKEKIIRMNHNDKDSQVSQKETKHADSVEKDRRKKLKKALSSDSLGLKNKKKVKDSNSDSKPKLSRTKSLSVVLKEAKELSFTSSKEEKTPKPQEKTLRKTLKKSLSSDSLGGFKTKMKTMKDVTKAPISGLKKKLNRTMSLSNVLERRKGNLKAEEDEVTVDTVGSSKKKKRSLKPKVQGKE